jgi:hypothetical protein
MLSMNNSLEKNEDETNNSNLSNEKKIDELSSSPSSFDKYRNIINIYQNPCFINTLFTLNNLVFFLFFR